MEVTKTNFKEVLKTLPEVFEKADFLAFDTEFTGLRIQEATPYNYYDNVEDVYQKDMAKAERFMAVQYGIVAFQYDKKKSEYSHRAYNFYVYPSSLNQNCNFLCEASSMEFLAQHGFDFNTLFRDGIPYIIENKAEKLVEKLKEKHKKDVRSEPPPKMDVKIPDEHKAAVEEIHKKIKNLLKEKKSATLSVDKNNRFVRRLIYQSVNDKFKGAVHLETRKDEKMEITVGLTEKEMMEKREERFLAEKENILDEVGFCKVIKLIMKSGKTLIGHNMLKDLLFTIRQFVAPLPASYEEFKELAHFTFPRLIDTKHMASLNDFKGIKDSGLWNLAEHFKETGSFPSIQVANEGRGYTGQEEKCHEAAYDAYLTGICFVAMADQIGKLNMTNIHSLLSNSPLLEPVLNKLYVPRLHDVPYMNLVAPDVTPCRDGVFHLEFPAEWNRDDIIKLFNKEYGFINICWINSTSAYVSVKIDQASKVLKKMPKVTEHYRLQTHKEFKASQVNGNKACSGEKRLPAEDIGEVVERPVKKKCSFDTPPFE